jgi:hypothetical protein
MQNSYRISTEIGKDKIVNFQLDQSIEFLEILSFKVRFIQIYIFSILFKYIIYLCY